MESEVQQRSPRAPLSAVGYRKEKHTRHDAPLGAQADTSLPEKVGMTSPLKGSPRSLGRFEPRNGAQFAEQQQQQQWREATPSGATAGADGQGLRPSDEAASGPNSDGQFMCPWPKCDALCCSKRDRMVHLRAHRRQSRSCLRYDDSAAKDVPPALLCPISNKLMFEAVINAHDGHTYNRVALEARLAQSCGGPLQHHGAPLGRSPSVSRSISSSSGGYGGGESGGSKDERGRDRSRDRDLIDGRSGGGNGRNATGVPPPPHGSSSYRRGGGGNSSSRFSDGPSRGAPVLVPNWAVRRLLHEWCRCVGLEPPPATAPGRFPPHALLPPDKATSFAAGAAAAAAKSDAQSAAESLGAALAAVSTTTSPRRPKKGQAAAAATTSSAAAMDESSSDDSDEEDFVPGAQPLTLATSSSSSTAEGKWAIRSPADSIAATEAASFSSSNSSSSSSSSSSVGSATEVPTNNGRRKRKAGAAAAAVAPSVPVSTAFGSDGVRIKRRPGNGVATTALPPAELAAFYGIAPPPSPEDGEPKHESSGGKKGSSSKEGKAEVATKKGDKAASKKERLSSEGTDVYLVDRILDARTLASNKREYLVKWEGYDDPKDNTWEPASNILCDDLVEQFEADLKDGKKAKAKRKSKGTVSDDDEDDDEDYDEGGDDDGKANKRAQKGIRARANELKDSSDENEDFAGAEEKGQDRKNNHEKESNDETKSETGNEVKPKVPPARAPNLIPLKKKALRPPASVSSSSGAAQAGASGQGSASATDAGAKLAPPQQTQSSSSLVAEISAAASSTPSSSSRPGPGAGNIGGFSSSSNHPHHTGNGRGISKGDAAGTPAASATRPFPALTPLSPVSSSSADPSLVASNVSKLGRQRRLLSEAVRNSDVAAVETLLSAEGSRNSSDGGEGGGLANHVFADLAVELRESRIDHFLRREVCPWVNDLRECIDLNDRRGVASSLLLPGATDAEDALSSLGRIATLLRQILATWLEVSQGRAQHHQSPSNRPSNRHHGSEAAPSRKGRPSLTHSNSGNGDGAGSSSSLRRTSSSQHSHHPADRLADPFALPLPSPKTPSSSHGHGGGGVNGFNGSHHGSSGGGGGSASAGTGASLASLAVVSGAPQEVSEMVEVDVAEEACCTGHLEWVRAALVGDSGKNMIHVKRATGVSALLKKSSLGLGSSSLHFVLRAKTSAEMARGQLLIRDLVDTVTANYRDLVRSSSSSS